MKQPTNVSKCRANLAAACVALMMLGATPAGPGQAAPGEEQMEGWSILERHLKSVGGAGAVKSIESFHIAGKYILEAPKLEGRLDLYFKRPDRILYLIDIPGFGRMARGHDGTTGWAADPQQGVRILAGEELRDLRRWTVRGFSLLPDASIYSAAVPLGIQEFSGKRCHLVRLVMAETGQESRDYFDAETGLFAGRQERFQAPTGPADLEGTATDYRAFGELRIPTVWKHRAVGQEWTAIYETFEVNKVDPAVFRPPEEVQSLLKGG